MNYRLGRLVAGVLFGMVVSVGGLRSGALYAQEIAFTFDDLPSHGELPPGETRLDVANLILATLKANHMPPTWGMVNGIGTTQDPNGAAVLKAWRAAGQPLGSHTWSHMSLTDHTAEEFEQDIARNEPLLESLMQGENWRWLRYPFLQEGDTLEKRNAVRAYLRAHGYTIAQVSMGFGDYLWNSPYARCVVKGDQEKSIEWLRASYLAAAEADVTASRDLAHQVYGRDVPYVLLLHIGAFDAKMLPELIALYRNKGYTFVSLPEAEKDPAYGDDPGLAGKYGGPLLEQMATAKKLKFPPSSKPEKELEALCR